MPFLRPISDRYFEDYIEGDVHCFGTIVVEADEIVAFAKRAAAGNAAAAAAKCKNLRRESFIAVRAPAVRATSPLFRVHCRRLDDRRPARDLIFDQRGEGC